MQQNLLLHQAISDHRFDCFDTCLYNFVSGGITAFAMFDTVLINVENTGFRLFSAPETELAIVLKLSMIVFPVRQRFCLHHYRVDLKQEMK